MGKFFCCYCRDNENLEIEIPFVEEPLGAKAFNEKMNKRLLKAGIEEKYSNEILSFLHEIGHIKTYSKINDFTYCKIATLITFLQNNFFADSKTMTDLCFKWYFSLALEKNADKWVIEYIKDHKIQVRQWETMLANNYKQIFKKVIDKF